MKCREGRREEGDKGIFQGSDLSHWEMKSPWRKNKLGQGWVGKE